MPPKFTLRKCKYRHLTYIENVVSFLVYALNFSKGCHIYNFVDKPDLDMNTLVTLVKKELGKDGKISLRIPYSIGYLGSLIFDIIARATDKKFPISAIRIKKFCSNTQFTSSNIKNTGFIPPFTLEEGLRRTIKYEFLSNNEDNKIVFYTE